MKPPYGVRRMEAIQEAITETEAEAEIDTEAERDALIDTVAERWGYYFGKRTTQSELMQSFTAERTQVRATGSLIKAKIADYLKNGTDVRDEVNSMQGVLKEAKETLSELSKPYYEKISPLNKALSYLDKVVIPMQIEQATGKAVMPKFQVSDYTKKAIESADASK